MSTHIYKFEVVAKHIDPFGHVNNAEYFRIFEEARWKLISENGFGREVVAELQQGPVMLQANVKFKKELREGQSAFIETRAKAKNKKIHLIYQTIKDSEDQICTEAEFVFGFIDMKKRKLVELTDRWKDAVKLSE